MTARGWDQGDYTCPQCHYRTLRRSAPRCPLCHADPGAGYWSEVYQRERAQKLAMEQAAIAAEARANEELNSRLFAWVWFFYLLPLLTFTSGSMLISTHQAGESSGIWLILVPGVNWLVLLGLIFFTSFTAMALTLVAIWSVLGAVIWRAIRAVPSRSA